MPSEDRERSRSRSDGGEVLVRRPAPDLGRQLRRWRRDRGLSLRDAIVELDVSFSYLQKLETGGKVRPPKLLFLQRIAAVYDVPTAAVFEAAGVTEQRLEDARYSLDRAFSRLVLHERLRPDGMDEAWTASFSSKQKRQWIEFAQRLEEFVLDMDREDGRDVEAITAGVRPFDEEDDD